LIKERKIMPFEAKVLIMNTGKSGNIILIELEIVSMTWRCFAYY